MRRLTLICLALLGGCPGDAAVSVWESFERTLAIEVVATNPFDPREVRVDVEIAAPDGAKRTELEIHANGSLDPETRR